MPPLAQDLTDQQDDINMNKPEGFVTFTNSVEENLGRNGVNKAARFSWMGLDTAELVQNAQKLLQSVSATLQRSEKVATGSLARSEKPSAVQYVVTEKKQEGEVGLLNCNGEHDSKLKQLFFIHIDIIVLVIDFQFCQLAYIFLSCKLYYKKY